MANAHDGHGESHGHKHDGHKHDGHKHDGHKHDGHKHDGHKHDGHKHDGRDVADNPTPKRIDPEDPPSAPKNETPSAPRNIKNNDHGREQLAPTSPAPPKRNRDEQTMRSPNLRVIAIRLEYAVEIIRDEIDFDVHCYDRDDLLDAADVLEKDARHFRASVEAGGDLQDVRLDFQRMTDSFEKLANPLERHYGSILIDRAMSRVDRLLRDVNQRLRKVDVQNNSWKSQGAALSEPVNSLPQAPAPNQTEGF